MEVRITNLQNRILYTPVSEDHLSKVRECISAYVEHRSSNRQIFLEKNKQLARVNESQYTAIHKK